MTDQAVEMRMEPVRTTDQLLRTLLVYNCIIRVQRALLLRDLNRVTEGEIQFAVDLGFVDEEAVRAQQSAEKEKIH